MTTFYMIRHGEPYWDLNESYQLHRLKGHGRDLVPLTSNGISQVHTAAQDKRLRKAEIIISSPYTRALQTAAILSKELQLDITVEFDLREWQPDLTFEFDSSETLKELGDDYDRHEGIYPAGEVKRWESREMMKRRVDGVLERYLHYDYVIVTGHGMAFRTQTDISDIPHAAIVELVKKNKHDPIVKGSCC